MASCLILAESSNEARDKQNKNDNASKLGDTSKNKRSLPLLLGETWSEDLGQGYIGSSAEEWPIPRSEGLHVGCDGWSGGTEVLNIGYMVPPPKTVTIVKETRVPVPVEKQIPYPVYKEVPYPVHVKVPQPYPVEKKVLIPVKVTHTVPEIVHKPVPVERIVKVPVEVSSGFKLFELITTHFKCAVEL